MHNCAERGEVRQIQREFSMPYEVLKARLGLISPTVFGSPRRAVLTYRRLGLATTSLTQHTNH